MMIHVEESMSSCVPYVLTSMANHNAVSATRYLFSALDHLVRQIIDEIEPCDL